METIWNRCQEFIWNEQFWLGDDARWEDFVSDDPSVYYPKISHMNWSIVIGVLLLFVRYMIESILIKPLAHCLGLRERKLIYLPDLPPLEAAYRTYRSKIPQSEIEKLLKQLNMTEKQVQRWLFKRRLREVPSSMYKFTECSWQFLFYTVSFSYGLYALWDKPWLWVTVNCWVGWPKQHIDNDIFILYLLELSFYWSLLFDIFFKRDYQKKDKKEMIMHHLATILLVYFSWACNFVRGGSLILVLHDAADPWLNITKMFKYAKYQTMCEISFVILLFVWIISRLVVFPIWILNTTAVEIHDYVTTFPAYWFFNGLLLVLQLLHIMWTYLILNIAFQKFQTGAIEKDVRSESDDELSESSASEDSSSVQRPLIEQTSALSNGVRPRKTIDKFHH
ncbi:unnamed protein product [Candidula unifasciata]|uniref:Uncharacterized protein n=1 Tax=Candidula unifasciata TaxID=100452 RepID=A0A8S3YQQ9_9EUPU|nr:unnamed protein product [Candidula unifasciata]